MDLSKESSSLRELYDIRSDRHQAHGGSFEGDLHGQLRNLREHGPIHRGTVAQLVAAPFTDYLSGHDEDHWSLVDWATCARTFRDSETFSSALHRSRPVMGGEANSIIGMGGAEHRRYRALVHPEFVRPRAKWWVDTIIRGLVNDLITDFEADGQADLNLQFCAPLPLFVTTRSLGVPDAEALNYSHLSNLMYESSSYEASAALHDLLLPMVHDRAEHPRDDLLSVLTQAELTDDEGTHRLPDEEITAFARLLLVGGIGTTWRQLGILLLALLSQPEHLEAVRQDRSLLPAAIEEGMRWEANIPLMRRLVTKDVTLHGAEVSAGSVVEISISAANRDPGRWASPDEFDIHRRHNPHLAYGAGPHICLGMHVANAEMLVAMEAVLDRLPNLRLDPGVETPRIVGFEHRAVTSLPVLFG